jgi:hypothetical protein
MPFSSATGNNMAPAGASITWPSIVMVGMWISLDQKKRSHHGDTEARRKPLRA